MRLDCARDSARVLSPSTVTEGGGEDEQKQQQKVMKRVRSKQAKQRERENARVILVLRMFQVR